MNDQLSSPPTGPEILTQSEAERQAEEAKLRRFRPWRDLPPFLIAALILWLVLQNKDWNEIQKAVSECRLGLFLLGASLYTLGHFLINGLSYRCLYHWFLVRVKTAEMLKLYAAAMLPQALVGPLGQITILIYMIRKKRLRVWPTLGLSGFLSYCDVWVMVLALALALLLKPRTEFLVYVWFGISLFSQFFWTWFLLLKGGRWLFPRFYHSPLFLVFRVARRGHYFRLLGLRLFWPVIQVCAHLLSLRAMGIQAPLAAVIVIVTLMTVTSFLPISALGFGAPNWAAEYFAPYVVSPEHPLETAIAYGLLFQTCFLLGRLFLGSVFFLPFWKEATRTHQPDHVQHPGETQHFKSPAE